MATLSSQSTIVLPGDELDPSLIPTHKKLPLRLGPGLRHVPPSEIVPTVAGQLVMDRKKNSMWVEYNGGRYVPSQGDLVIAQIHHSGGDLYFASLAPHCPHATLPVLAFESATRKTRPVLAPGALVYARVALADRHMDAELECVSPATGRADGLGPLAAGTAFAVSLGFARRLLMQQRANGTAAAAAGGGGGEPGGSQLVILDALGEAGLAFETAVGRNGRVWVRSESTRTMLLVGRALAETDEKDLDVDAQRKLVRNLLKSTG